MVGESEILLDLVQFTTHQQNIALQNNLLCRFYREILKQSLFPNKPFFHIISYFDAKHC